MKTIIGIDPGRAGGFAVISDHGTTAEPMPDTPNELARLIRDAYAFSDKAPVCFLEEVSGYVGKDQPASRAGVLLRNFGQCEGVIATLGIPLILIRPQRWQKHLGLGIKGARSKTAWKNHLKALACRLFPDIRVTLKTSDALLIAEYGRRVHV